MKFPLDEISSKVGILGIDLISRITSKLVTHKRLETMFSQFLLTLVGGIGFILVQVKY